MKNLLIACLFISNISLVSAQDTESKEVALIKAVVQYYHKALEDKDKETALKLLSDDVLIQEGGYLQTAEEYKSHHLMLDMEFSSAVSGKREVIEAVVEGNIGWVVASSSMIGEFQGEAVNSIGAALMVLKKENGSWKIRVIHFSSRKNK